MRSNTNFEMRRFLGASGGYKSDTSVATDGVIRNAEATEGSPASTKEVGIGISRPRAAKMELQMLPP